MRQAFKMKLKKGFEKEYERRHNLLWPEMKQLLHDSGVSDYTIFLDEETGTLFAYQLSATENGSQDLGDNPVVQKWWHYMADIMEVNPDESPVSIPLHEVFHLD